MLLVLLLVLQGLLPVSSVTGEQAMRCLQLRQPLVVGA